MGIDSGQPFCYLTTTGRVTGQPHEIEIWFGVHGDTLYLLSGGRDRSDWVRNIKRNPDVYVRVGDRAYRAHGRVVEPGCDEDALARRLLLEKYAPSNRDLRGRTALPVALDLAESA